MLRSTITAICFLLATTCGLAAQGGEMGVSLTILEPLALTAAPQSSTVRHRAGEYVEVSMPLQPAGSETRIVAVSAAAGGADGPQFRIRGPGGSYEPLTGDRAVALGPSGKVGRAQGVEAVYRLDLGGKPAPRDLRLTVSYLIAPDA